MKRYFLLIISILTLGFSLKAQDAETMFKAAVDKLKSYDNIEIAFDYNMINREAGIFETMEGYGFLKGNAYKLAIMGQEIVCDGITTWTYNADANEVMIGNVDPDEGSTPLSLINSYYDNITAKYISEDNNIKKIEIRSLLSDDNFDRIIVTLNASTLEIKEIHAFDKEKTEFAYIINKFVTNQKLPADFFTYKEAEHPDAEIVDMR